MLPPKGAGNFAKTPNCTGQNVSPPLAWTNAPEKTRSFVLIWDDQAGRAGLGALHAVIYGIPQTLANAGASRFDSKSDGITQRSGGGRVTNRELIRLVDDRLGVGGRSRIAGNSILLQFENPYTGHKRAMCWHCSTFSRRWITKLRR